MVKSNFEGDQARRGRVKELRGILQRVRERTFEGLCKLDGNESRALEGSVSANLSPEA